MRIGVLATIFTLVSGAAQAGDVKCLWNALPKAMQEKLLVNDPIGPLPRAAEVAIAKCASMTPEQAARGEFPKISAYATVSYASELAFSYLIEIEGVSTRAKLEAAWAGLPPEDRKTIREAAEAELESGKLPGWVEEALARAARSAGWQGVDSARNNDQTYVLFKTFFTSRGGREAYEAKF